MSKTLVSTFIAAAFMGLVGAVASPLADTDFTTLPPTHAEVQKQVAASKVSLAQAIDIAQKDVKGLAKSASMNLKDSPPTVEVVVYGDDAATKVVVNAQTGAVVSKTAAPWLPGVAVEGPWVETESGLKYFEIKPGEGDPLADKTAVIRAMLKGYLVDGTPFANPTEPLLLGMNQVFPGLAEGLTGMKAGGKRKLVLPPNLAFGDKGNQNVPPKATLIFDVELLNFDWAKLPATLPGVAVTGDPVTTPSGLKYYEVEVGGGEQPADPTAQVKVHYTGWLVDGTKFDSSVDSGTPATFVLNRVIKGWTEAVSTMKVGGRRKLIIPSDLGYGDSGNQGIPPKSTLIFDVELLEIVKATAPQVPPVPAPPGGGANPSQPGR